MPRSYPSFVAGLAYPSPSGGSRGRYAARHVRVGDELELRPEPDNPHDEDAVATYHRGFHLGYVPAKHVWVARSIDEGDMHRVRITSVETTGFWIFRQASHVSIMIEIVSDG
jgi:hypothetical protein